uniref:RRM domain-containing protein n=1 Tax=Bionectria ochroleuca TaxID=29856 RepID=A0A0B7KDP8_BIOOC
MDLLGYWTQDLKDFARQSSLDVVYSETGRDSNGRGFVEFESAADLRTAVEKLDGREFKGSRVQCVADTQPDIPASRGRSRSPGPGRRPYPPPTDDYDRRQPPRGYSPRRDAPYGYRDRSPRRDYYDDRGPRAYRSPPRRPEGADYPPRGRYDDPYRRDYAPPPDPYTNGRPYERAPRDYPPPRDAPYPREGYPPREYERGGRYW